MPPSKQWARKAVGSNGSRGMALSSFRGTTTPMQRTLALNQYVLDATLGKPLPRPADVFSAGLFTPDTPSPTYPLDRPRGNAAGGPDPRNWQYPVAWNLPTGPRVYEAVSFDTLRACAKQVDPVRACIQILKDEVFGADWSIRVRDPNLARIEGREYKKEERKQIEGFFQRPDSIRGLNFAAFGKLWLEEVLVTDALSVYPRRTLLHQSQGAITTDLAALQIIDGATIKPLLDLQGGRPQYPYPAYQQYLYGVPRSEFAAYTTPEMLPENFDPSVPAERNILARQLLYQPLVQSANSVYGLPPTEQVLQTAVTWLRRMSWWQSYYVEGDVPAAFVMGGEGWTPDQLERWESAMHGLMAGDPTFRHRLKAIPYGTNVKEMKQPNFEVAFDEFLLKLVAMTFRVTSSELFGLSTSNGAGGRGFLEEQMNIGERKGVLPYRRAFESFCDNIIATEFHQPDLCLRFDNNDMRDALKQAQIDDVNLKNGSTFIEEVRERRGVGSLDMPEALVPHIETRAGLTSLDQIDEFNRLALQGGKAGEGGVARITGIGNENETQVGSHPGPREGAPSAQKAASADELAKFAKFVSNPRNNGRGFDFKALPKELSEMLEKMAMNWSKE